MILHIFLWKHKVSEEQILRCQNDPNVKDVMFDTAKQALAQLDAVSNKLYRLLTFCNQ